MKILFIVYYFPPDGGPAVQRIVKFIKYLAHHDVQSYVIAAKHPNATRDNTLFKEIPDSTRIIHIRDWFAWLPGEIKKRFKSKFVPDRHMFWNKSAVKHAANLINKENIEIVFTSSPPHSVQLIGLTLKRQLDIKWITDFRDEWTNDPVFKHAQKDKIDAG